MLNVELPEALEKELQNLAARTGRSSDDIIRDAVADYLEDLEDIQLAEESLREGGKRYSLDEIERELGMED